MIKLCASIYQQGLLLGPLAASDGIGVRAPVCLRPVGLGELIQAIGVKRMAVSAASPSV